MTSTELVAPLDLECLQELFNFFSEHGKFVPLLQKLCWTNKQKQSVKGAGLYCFTQTMNKNISVTTFLYVGRTRTLHQRFNQHRNAWLNKYVLLHPNYQFHWGYVRQEDVPSDYCSVAESETAIWKFKKELGLTTGKELQRLTKTTV